MRKLNLLVIFIVLDLGEKFAVFRSPTSLRSRGSNFSCKMMTKSGNYLRGFGKRTLHFSESINEILQLLIGFEDC